MPARRSPRAQLALAIAFLAATASLCATAAGSPVASGRESPGTWCGGSLWRLMTLSDSDRTKVNLQGTPTTIADIPGNDRPTVETLVALMAQDKKVRDGQMTFILAHDIGKTFVSRDVSQSDIASFLAEELRMAPTVRTARA